MAEIDTQVLPLLPLTTGVVLPGMVVTLTIESDEAQAAVEAADGGELLLVPRVGDRYARVGTVAQVEDVGRLRNGTEALVIRGLHRAVVGLGVPGTGGATWVQVEPVEDADRHRARRRSWRASTAPSSRTSSRRAASRRSPSSSAGSPTPARSPTPAATRPTCRFEQKVEVLETLDVEQRLEIVLGWAKDVLAELELKEKIRTDVTEGMEKRQREFLLRQQMSAIRKELGEDGEENVVEEYRKQDRRGRHARGRREGGRARARPAGAHLRAVARARLDPHLPRLDARDPVGRAHRRQPRHRRGARACSTPTTPAWTT